MIVLAKKNNYFQVPNDIFDRAITINANGKQRNLSAIEKLVYIYICRCSNNTDTAFPSYTTIANKCNIGRSSAINAIKVLAENEFIKKTWRKNPDATDNKKNHTNEYIISSGPSDTPVNNKNNASGIFDTPPSPPDTPPLVQEIDLGGPSDTPRRITTYKEPIKEEPIKKEIPLSLLEERKPDIVKQWDREREKIKHRIKLDRDKHPYFDIWFTVYSNAFKNGAVFPEVKVDERVLPEALEKLNHFGEEQKEDMHHAIRFYIYEQKRLRQEPDILDCINRIIDEPKFWEIDIKEADLF